MKKSMFFYLFISMTNTSWASCVLTTDMLKNGGQFDYDDYLYLDSQDRELRKENKPGKAYLCGAGYCEPGTKIRAKEAMVGNGHNLPDSVYECINSSTSGRTSYKWVVYQVHNACVVTPPLVEKQVSGSEVMNAGTLFVLNVDNTKKYCSSVNKVQTLVEADTNIWDTFNTGLQESGATSRNFLDNATTIGVTAIDGGIELTLGYAKENTKRLQILTNGYVRLLDSAGRNIGNTVSDTWKTTADGFVRIYDSTGKTLIGGLQIMTNGVVNIVNSRNEVIKSLSDNTTEAYKATLGFFASAISDFNVTLQTVIKAKAQVLDTTVKELHEDWRNLLDNATTIGVTAIDGGIELTLEYAKENTKRLQILTTGYVSILDSFGNTVRGVWKTSVDGFVRIYDITGKTLVGGMQIMTDGVVKIVDSHNKVKMTLTKEAGKSYRATLGFFSSIIGKFTDAGKSIVESGLKFAGVAVQELSADWRNFLDNATNLGVTAINGGIEIAKNNTERMRILEDGTVKIVGTMGRTFAAVWEASANGVVKIYDITSNTLIGGMQILKDGTIQIFDSTNKMITQLSNNTTEAYKATLGFFGSIIVSFNDTVQTAIKSAASVANVSIKELGATARTAITNATDFAKHFTTEIIGGVKAYQINQKRLKELEIQISKCQTQEQVAILIENALKEAELSDAQCARVREMINEYARKNNQRLDIIENRIMSLEHELQKLKQQNIELAQRIDSLGGEYRNLAVQVRTKVNAKQVITLIDQYTQSFSDGQTKQLYQILKEYTNKLSDGQRAEVQGLISAYVDPKLAQINDRIDRESERNAAANKVLSSMSVLNSFAASAEVSVWKTADGKFNGARLASDSIAGAVLGTVGGVISNTLIKKSQTKKGFEDIRCSVGGQFVADYKDEFTVGIMR